MARSPMTSAPASRAVAERSLDEYDADLYAGYLRDLRQELQEPPELLPCHEPLLVHGSGRGRVTHDGVAVWFE